MGGNTLLRLIEGDETLEFFGGSATRTAMKQEIDRYRRLLQEWGGDTQGGIQEKPAAASNPSQPRGETPQATSGPSSTQRIKIGKAQTTPVPDLERYPSGAILVLNDEELVIYRRGVVGQPVDMVYSLLSDGNVKIEALNLAEYQISELGCLSPDALKRLQAQMTWNRALVGPHCTDAGDAERIPEPNPPRQASPQPQMRRPAAPTPVPRDSRPSQGANGLRSAEAHFAETEGASSVSRGALDEEGKIRLRRGQRVVLKFGNKAWEAVYWGKDQTGPVVAHCTHKHWQLMHLDLNRFRDCIVPSDEPDQELMDEIMRELSTKMSQ